MFAGFNPQPCWFIIGMFAVHMHIRMLWLPMHAMIFGGSFIVYQWYSMMWEGILCHEHFIVYIYIQSHNISDVWVVYRKICIRMVYLKFDMYCLHQHRPHARGRPLPSGGWVQQRGKPFWWYGSYGSGWPVFNTWGNMGNLSGTVCIYNVCTN